MWIVYMLYAEVNTAQTTQNGATLLANGLIRVQKMQVGRSETREDARVACVNLAEKTLKDRGSNTTVIGYGIRNFYAEKGAKLDWQMSLQQLVEVLRNRRKARLAAEEAA